MPVQLARIVELSKAEKITVEEVIKSLLVKNPDLGTYHEFEKVFIRIASDQVIEQISSTYTEEMTRTGQSIQRFDAFQICTNCKNRQSTLIRQCTNCKEPLSFCNLCRRGFSNNDVKLECPKCKNQFHRIHLYASIQSHGSCPVCKEGLTLGQFE